MKICQKCGINDYNPEKVCKNCGDKFKFQKNDCNPVYWKDDIPSGYGNYATSRKPLSDEDEEWTNMKIR